ncbi:hypothetical protein QYE76_032161 [Lolium multiflorum]|uniref:Uncharacterized protein n=1 Tax=Lolium multiflorum TaxID=4521 RepID=A0AAD8QWP3_LOLMU|nr:hypothetical protein QYE76_032161 [Lolium multiflorum]
MGKPRDTKIAILPSTTRKGTTLSTSAALDSPSVIDKLVSPPHASRAGTSAESENSHNIDNVSAVLDDSGSLGSFLDATIAKSRQIENTETPNVATPVNSPESVEYSSDDLDEDYVELNDDFIEKCNATTDARKIKKLLASQPDHDLEKNDLLDIFYSGLTIESRAYLDSCAGCVFRKRTPEDAEELLAKIGRNHDDWSTPEPTPTPIVKKRGMIKLNDEDMREAKKSLKEKGIKPEDVKNLPPIEDICETIPPSSMIEDFKFNWSRSDPMVQYKIYNKAVNLPFGVFCAAIGVPQWGSCEKIRGTPRELSDLYTRICNGRSLSNDDGATYQRMMQKCLAKQISKNIQVYIDDVVITTKKGSSLIDDLKETLDNLDKFCLKLNPAKYSFGVPAGELLGYLVSARGIETNPEKIQAIVTMRKPTKLKEIQQLTGRVVALSRFVARLGEKALPFYALIKQGEKFEWNEEAYKAFEHIKQWMELQNTGPPDLSSTWLMNFDGPKRLEGAGAGVILVSPQGDKMKYILRMTFPNGSNNKAKYEALIHGMKMAKACGATRLKIFGDSQLVAQQVMNKCDAVNDIMIAYKEVYNELEKLFDGCEVNHISRLSNDEADVLANIGSQCLPVPPGVFWEEISERSTKAKKIPKKSKKKETFEKDSGAPTSPEVNTSEDEEEPHEVMMVQVPWMQVYVAYITRKEIPEDPVEARRVIRRSKAFTVVKGELYK